MQAGTLLDYTIRLYGLTVHWRTEITVWEPPRRFVDIQKRGPYRSWIHEHLFEPSGAGTLMRDRVEYAVPGGVLEPLLHRLFVEPDLERIFTYRGQRIQEHFAGP